VQLGTHDPPQECKPLNRNLGLEKKEKGWEGGKREEGRPIISFSPRDVRVPDFWGGSFRLCRLLYSRSGRGLKEEGDENRLQGTYCLKSREGIQGRRRMLFSGLSGAPAQEGNRLRTNGDSSFVRPKISPPLP